MKKYPNLKELSDGRAIYTTHNGFQYWLRDQKGNHQQITYDYYKQTLELYKKQQRGKSPIKTDRAWNH